MAQFCAICAVTSGKVREIRIRLSLVLPPSCYLNCHHFTAKTSCRKPRFCQFCAKSFALFSQMVTSRYIFEFWRNFVFLDVEHNLNLNVCTAYCICEKSGEFGFENLYSVCLFLDESKQVLTWEQAHIKIASKCMFLNLILI